MDENSTIGISRRVLDGGLESEDAVRDVLADGYVFELAYRADENEQILQALVRVSNDLTFEA